MGTSVRHAGSVVLPSVVSTAVRPDEVFESWLCRLSALRSEPVASVLAVLGDGASELEWLWSFDDEAALGRLSLFARVDIEVLRASLFSAASAGIVPVASSALEAGRRGWVSLGSIRFCPPCVAEGSGLSWRWALGCSVACVEHGVLLRLGCACGEKRWSTYTRPPRRVGQLDVCPSCGGHLGALSSVPADSDVLTAQEVVDAAMSGSGLLFGEAVEPMSWFRSLTSSAALASIALGVGKGRLFTPPSVIPVDPSQADRVLVDAVAALTTRDVFRELAASAIRAHRRSAPTRFTLGADVKAPDVADVWDEVESEMRYRPGFRYDPERLSRRRVTPMDLATSDGERKAVTP